MSNIEIVNLHNPINFQSVGRPVPENHSYFDTPHTLILLGQKRCGKTNWCLNALKNAQLYNQHFINIAVFSPNGDQFDQSVIGNQQYVFTSFTDEKLKSVIDLALENKQNGDDLGQTWETLLIIDDAMGSDILKSRYFKSLMSRHRNINMSIWFAIQDLVEMNNRLRGLFDVAIVWPPLKSDVLCIVKGLETPTWPKNDLLELFKSQQIYQNSHDFVSFNKRKKQILRNLQEEIHIKQ